jgi:two-component system sensor kinase FixL
LRLMEAETIDLVEIREIFQDIVAANQRAAEVIRQMRGLVKKEHEPSFTILDLGDIVRDVATLVRSDALMHDVHVTLDIDAELPTVSGDRIQLQQVVLNLLLNAFEAAEESPGGGRDVIVRAYRASDKTNRVAVTDHGPGITSAALERIFEPFYTTKRDGLGMGLSICRSIIHAHHGTMTAENNADHGATFAFSLPICNA